MIGLLKNLFFQKGGILMHDVIVETPRLLLRRWRPEDLAPFARMNADPVVMEYFVSPYTEERTQAFFQKIQEEFAEYGYGLYAAQEKASNLFMGFIGFHWARLGPSGSR